MTESEKKNKLNEIRKIVNQKKLEYIINKYEAQEIVYGINFLIKENKDFNRVDKESFRLTKIELAIKYKIDWNITSVRRQDSQENQKLPEDQKLQEDHNSQEDKKSQEIEKAYLKNIVDSLEHWVSKMEEEITPSKNLLLINSIYNI